MNNFLYFNKQTCISVCRHNPLCLNPLLCIIVTQNIHHCAFWSYTVTYKIKNEFFVWNLQWVRYCLNFKVVSYKKNLYCDYFPHSWGRFMTSACLWSVHDLSSVNMLGKLRNLYIIWRFNGKVSWLKMVGETFMICLQGKKFLYNAV